MMDLEQVKSRISIAEIKELAETFPEPVKTDILEASDTMSREEFLIRFIGWRKQLRTLKRLAGDHS